MALKSEIFTLVESNTLICENAMSIISMMRKPTLYAIEIQTMLDDFAVAVDKSNYIKI